MPQPGIPTDLYSYFFNKKTRVLQKIGAEFSFSGAEFRKIRAEFGGFIYSF